MLSFLTTAPATSPPNHPKARPTPPNMSSEVTPPPGHPNLPNQVAVVSEVPSSPCRTRWQRIANRCPERSPGGRSSASPPVTGRCQGTRHEGEGVRDRTRISCGTWGGRRAEVQDEWVMFQFVSQDQQKIGTGPYKNPGPQIYPGSSNQLCNMYTFSSIKNQPRKGQKCCGIKGLVRVRTAAANSVGPTSCQTRSRARDAPQTLHGCPRRLNGTLSLRSGG